MSRKAPRRRFSSAQQDEAAARRCIDSPQTRSPSYRLAYTDTEFMLRDEVRPVRLQLELLKPELLQQEYGIDDTVVVFGSARVPDPEVAATRLAAADAAAAERPDDPATARALALARRAVANSRYYQEARRFGQLVATLHHTHPERGPLFVVTGGGPGLMEAANRGAHDRGALSVGMNIVLPAEQAPNPYATPDLSFQFHYFAIRKMHLLMRARALAAFPGGFGTFDELFETLTLVQTGKIEPVPVLLFGREFWERVICFDVLVEEGMIAPADLELIHYVETAEEAIEVILETNHVARR